MKPLAANVSLMVIVIALQPAPSLELLDRYLVAAELLAIRPLILLNKSDLLDKRRHPLREFMNVYKGLGYDVLEISVEQHKGFKPLIKQLKDNTSIFVGQSGVGKSSLIASLLPAEDIRIGELSDASGLGKHTTSTPRLYHFPEGGHIIDSPGVRSFALWHAEPAAIFSGFREFRPYQGQCKFRDCKHLNEPDCALLDAVDAGDINEVRFENYHKIIGDEGQR